MSANGRVKPDFVIVDGNEAKHLEGAYYIERRDGGKRIRLSVGKDVADAAAMRLCKETELNQGDGSVPELKANNRHKSLTAAVRDYLDEVRLTKKPKTLAAYTTALDYFTESCHKLHINDIDRKDPLKFAAFLRDVKEQSPLYTEEEPEIYEPAELDKLPQSL